MSLEIKEKIEMPIAVFLDASGTLLKSSLDSSIGVEIYPDAKKILEAFKKRQIANIKIKTGLITSWGNKIVHMLQALGIERYFDAIINSDSFEKTKPDASVFHHACYLVGSQSKYSFHIGDSLYDDALGAQNAGLQGIWLQRGNRYTNDVELLKNPFFKNLEAALAYLEKEFSNINPMFLDNENHSL